MEEQATEAYKDTDSTRESRKPQMTETVGSFTTYFLCS